MRAKLRMRVWLARGPRGKKPRKLIWLMSLLNLLRRDSKSSRIAQTLFCRSLPSLNLFLPTQTFHFLRNLRSSALKRKPKMKLFLKSTVLAIKHLMQESFQKSQTQHLLSRERSTRPRCNNFCKFQDCSGLIDSNPQNLKLKELITFWTKELNNLWSLNLRTPILFLDSL